MAYDTWSEAEAAAIKILGKGANIPEPKGQGLKAIDEFDKARKDFSTAYDEITKLRQSSTISWRRPRRLSAG